MALLVAPFVGLAEAGRVEVVRAVEGRGVASVAGREDVGRAVDGRAVAARFVAEAASLVCCSSINFCLSVSIVAFFSSSSDSCHVRASSNVRWAHKYKEKAADAAFLTTSAEIILQPFREAISRHTSWLTSDSFSDMHAFFNTNGRI